MHAENVTSCAHSGPAAAKLVALGALRGHLAAAGCSNHFKLPIWRVYHTAWGWPA